MFYANFFDNLLKSVRKKVLEMANIQKQDKVLDVCCGTGAQAILFSNYSDFVYGIDLDNRMIEFALNRKSRVNFGVAYAEHIPFPSEYFDIVSISLALHEKDEKLRKMIFSEIKRVVKKDGRIVIADYNYPLPFNFISFLVVMIERMAGNYHFNSFRNYLSLKGLDDLIKELKIEKQSFAIKKTIKIVNLKQ
ncbi:MAG: class I SAM-dependent methyltransferase [Candidatus Pacebacteria bacterium]|nr:class I SAM-dependent methyltransferase [Candidatus Paceibacterota bacterium]MDD5012932.1 class I SAM-dependent methyltransferase [Candidatus Paceibacterota bacterium]MDD5752516.1 class I SAM-dependent methyltransferase [Candidatus Paceibacterota bacterium]